MARTENRNSLPWLLKALYKYKPDACMCKHGQNWTADENNAR